MDLVVDKTLRRMVKFIEAEGDERVSEIERKTLEEAESRMGNTILLERNRVNAYYSKLEDKLERQWLTEVSRLVGRSKSALEKFKSLALEEVNAEVYRRIGQELGTDPGKYRDVFMKMLLQCLCMLMENRVGIRVRRDDVELARDVLGEVAARYRALSGRPGIRFELDDQVFLADEDMGGLILFAKAGTIKVRNTIKSRLELIYPKTVTYARRSLFAFPGAI